MSTPLVSFVRIGAGATVGTTEQAIDLKGLQSLKPSEAAQYRAQITPPHGQTHIAVEMTGKKYLELLKAVETGGRGFWFFGVGGTRKAVRELLFATLGLKKTPNEPPEKTALRHRVAALRDARCGDNRALNMICRLLSENRIDAKQCQELIEIFTGKADAKGRYAVQCPTGEAAAGMQTRIADVLSKGGKISEDVAKDLLSSMPKSTARSSGTNLLRGAIADTSSRPQTPLPTASPLTLGEELPQTHAGESALIPLASQNPLEAGVTPPPVEQQHPDGEQRDAIAEEHGGSGSGSGMPLSQDEGGGLPTGLGGGGEPPTQSGDQPQEVYSQVHAETHPSREYAPGEWESAVAEFMGDMQPDQVFAAPDLSKAKPAAPLQSTAAAEPVVHASPQETVSSPVPPPRHTSVPVAPQQPVPRPAVTPQGPVTPPSSSIAPQPVPPQSTMFDTTDAPVRRRGDQAPKSPGITAQEPAKLTLAELREVALKAKIDELNVSIAGKQHSETLIFREQLFKVSTDYAKALEEKYDQEKTLDIQEQLVAVLGENVKLAGNRFLWEQAGGFARRLMTVDSEHKEQHAQDAAGAYREAALRLLDGREKRPNMLTSDPAKEAARLARLSAEVWVQMADESDDPVARARYQKTAADILVGLSQQPGQAALFDDAMKALGRELEVARENPARKSELEPLTWTLVDARKQYLEDLGPMATPARRASVLWQNVGDLKELQLSGPSAERCTVAYREAITAFEQAANIVKGDRLNISSGGERTLLEADLLKKKWELLSLVGRGDERVRFGEKLAEQYRDAAISLFKDGSRLKGPEGKRLLALAAEAQAKCGEVKLALIPLLPRDADKEKNELATDATVRLLKAARNSLKAFVGEFTDDATRNVADTAGTVTSLVQRVVSMGSRPLDEAEIATLKKAQDYLELAGYESLSLQLDGVITATMPPPAAATVTASRSPTPPPDYAAPPSADLAAARSETVRLEGDLRAAKGRAKAAAAAIPSEGSAAAKALQEEAFLPVKLQEDALLEAYARAAELSQQAGLVVDAADYTKRGGEVLRIRFDRTKDPQDKEASYKQFCDAVAIVEAGYPSLVRSLSGPNRLEARYKLDLCRELLQNLPNGILELGGSLTVADEELDAKKREDYEQRGTKVIDIGQMLLRIGRELVTAGAADKGAEYCYAAANCLRSVTLGSRKMLKSQVPAINSVIAESSHELQHCLTAVAGLAQDVLGNPRLGPQEKADQLWLLAWARKGKAKFGQTYGFGPKPIFDRLSDASSNDAAVAFEGLAKAADSQRPPNLQAAAVALEGSARCFGNEERAGQAAIRWLKLAGIADAEHLGTLAGKSVEQLAVGLEANPDNAYRLLCAAKDLVEPIMAWQASMPYRIGGETLQPDQIRGIAGNLEGVARRLAGSDEAMKAVELRVASERQGVYNDPWAFSSRQR